MKRAAPRLLAAGVLAAMTAGAGLLATNAIRTDTLALPGAETAPPAEPPAPAAGGTDPAAPAASAAAPAAPRAAPLAPLERNETPMADRVAVLGVLNKRSGVARDVTLRPGQGARIGNLVIRLRACETTAPTEPEQLTGAYVQADRQGRDQHWQRIFSGWLYKETPSLNVVEDPLYDVWPKSCTMTHPDIGPETVAASGLGGGAARRSIAKKSAAEPVATPADPAPPPSASAVSSSPL